MTARLLLLGLLIGLGLSARADEVTICYNYGCAKRATVELRGAQLRKIRWMFHRLPTPAAERTAISMAIGRLETFAGQQTPTFADKGRNENDGEVDGRMDCIDHSTNTTAYLHLLEARGWLKYHRVLEPVKRAPFLVNEHWGARIAEKRSGREFVVDSWFFDNGHSAAIFPLDDWMNGASPDGND
jgi:hypothetical protein